MTPINMVIAAEAARPHDAFYLGLTPFGIQGRLRDNTGEISLDSDSVICPSCQSVAPIILDCERKSAALLTLSRARKRGVSRSSRTLGAGNDGRELAHADERRRLADGEVVWS
jgi:hypothetical protein